MYRLAVKVATSVAALAASLAAAVAERSDRVYSNCEILCSAAAKD